MRDHRRFYYDFSDLFDADYNQTALGAFKRAEIKIWMLVPKDPVPIPMAKKVMPSELYEMLGPDEDGDDLLQDKLRTEEQEERRDELS